MKRLLILVAACKTGGSVAPPAQPQPVAQRTLPPAKAGPATHVVALAAETPTPIMRGPFEITTINPGTALVLGIAKDETCANVVWSAYSGGGAAVGEGEVLCARAAEAGTHGFSGH